MNKHFTSQSACLWALALVILSFPIRGFAEENLVFTAVEPCRLFDTRISQGGDGPFSGEEARSYFVWGAAITLNEGANEDGCPEVAANPEAVVVVLSVVSPTNIGFVTAHAFGTERPVAASMTFTGRRNWSRTRWSWRAVH